MRGLQNYANLANFAQKSENYVVKVWHLWRNATPHTYSDFDWLWVELPDNIFQHKQASPSRKKTSLCERILNKWRNAFRFCLCLVGQAFHSVQKKKKLLPYLKSKTEDNSRNWWIKKLKNKPSLLIVAWFSPIGNVQRSGSFGDKRTPFDSVSDYCHCHTSIWFLSCAGTEAGLSGLTAESGFPAMPDATTAATAASVSGGGLGRADIVDQPCAISHFKPQIKSGCTPYADFLSHPRDPPFPNQR